MIKSVKKVYKSDTKKTVLQKCEKPHGCPCCLTSSEHAQGIHLKKVILHSALARMEEIGRCAVRVVAGCLSSISG